MPRPGRVPLVVPAWRHLLEVALPSSAGRLAGLFELRPAEAGDPSPGGLRLAEARAVVRGAVADAFPEADPVSEEHVVHIGLWGRDERHRTFRALEVEPWDDVQDNYASATRDQIGPLMVEGYSPDGRGQLLVWSGAPGTGKSFALGSLAYAWRSWAQFCFIADPETLLHDPGYLMEFILSRPPLDDRWRVGVLEDSGELFGSEGRREAGRALGSLLNTTDGMLGQNSKTMFVITTNEPVERFHAAVIRPGRCASRVSFDELPTEQARGMAAGAWTRRGRQTPGATGDDRRAPRARRRPDRGALPIVAAGIYL